MNATAIPKRTFLPRDEVQISLPPRALNIDDAGRYCGVPAWTIHEAIACGQLHAKRPGRARVILITELDRWLESLDDHEPSTAKRYAAKREVRP